VAEAVFGTLNVAEDLSWTLGNVNSLVEVLGIRNTCHHPDGSNFNHYSCNQ